MQCKVPFGEVEPTPIGERAVPRNEDDHRRLQRKRKRANGHVETQMEEEGSVDLEEEEVDMGYLEGESQTQPEAGPVSCWTLRRN